MRRMKGAEFNMYLLDYLINYMIQADKDINDFYSIACRFYLSEN
ncbi:TPA: hypothetical protein ACH354_002355 [Clostridium perfringens]